MVVLRATQKVLKLLPPAKHDVGDSDTALGDWYVNRIVVDRRPLLLLVSSKSRLSALTPARDVKTLPDRLSEIVAARLARLDVDKGVLAAEIEAMRVVAVAKTADRSITGQMVDFAKALPYDLSESESDEVSLQIAEDRLAETPCRVTGPFANVIFPCDTTLRLLESKWLGRNQAH